MSQELTITLPADPGTVWTQEAVDSLIGQHLDTSSQPGVGPVVLCMKVERAQIAEDNPQLAVIVVTPHLTVLAPTSIPELDAIEAKVKQVRDAGLTPIGVTITVETRHAAKVLGDSWYSTTPDGKHYTLFGLPIMGYGTDGVVV